MPEAVSEPDSKGRLLSGTRKLLKVGGSVMITMPKDWLEQHGYKVGDEIPFLANRDLVILAPETAADAYQTGSELVHKSREEAEKTERAKMKPQKEE